MVVTVSAELEEMIQHELDSGRYETVEQVLVNALLQLKQSHRWEPDMPLAEFQASLDEAWEAAERGELFSAEEACAYLAQVRTELNDAGPTPQQELR